MVVVPLAQREKEINVSRPSCDTEGANWARMAAAGGLVAGGVLLLTGNRRAGLVTAAGATALAVLDQQDVVKAWWDALPVYIDSVQRLLTNVEETVIELGQQRDRLHKILTR